MKNPIYILIFSLLFICCKKDDDTNDPLCSASPCTDVQVSNPLFNDAPSDGFEDISVEILGDCLVITIGYGGGSGEVFGCLVVRDLTVDAEEVRNIRFLFDDRSPKDAYFQEEFSFDLVPLRNPNTNSVTLLLQDFPDNPILYEY